MAKELALGDIEPAIEIFKQVNIKAVQKVLDRAERRALEAGRRQHGAAKRMMRPGKLAKALSSAMASHGRQSKGRPSIRLTAPDTGGRPYHFGFSVVTKGSRKENPTVAGRKAAGAGGADGTQGRGTMAGGQRHKAATREGAHQLYTERDAALDEGRDLEAPGLEGLKAPGIDEPGPAAGVGEEQAREGRSAGREPGAAGAEGVGEPSSERALRYVEDAMAHVPGLSDRASEAAAQAYIEDPSKLARLHGNTASFGTIGETVEERLRFWELVHERESEKGGRTQSRLVLELPHEASNEERHEIVRSYAEEMFGARGLPYWASIHAPTRGNDSRNHHAHVVFSTRPARRMVDRATGGLEWDFAVAEHYKRANRANAVRYPHAQNRDRGMQGRDWVKDARSRFAAVTNGVMERSGKGVRYDPRSYKDMGLEASPMKNVNRIVSDKARAGSFVVMDADWTRRMIEEEIKDAAIRRDGTFKALVRTEQMLADAARSAVAAQRVQARMPAHLRMGHSMSIGTAVARRITTAVLENERERLSQRFVDEATERTLRQVVQATAPKKGLERNAGDGAPEAGDLSALHAAAQEELAAHRQAARRDRFGLQARLDALRMAWSPASTTKAATGGDPGGPSPGGAGPASPRQGPEGQEAGAAKGQASTPAPPPPPPPVRAPDPPRNPARAMGMPGGPRAAAGLGMPDALRGIAPPASMRMAPPAPGSRAAAISAGMAAMVDRDGPAAVAAIVAGQARQAAQTAPGERAGGAAAPAASPAGAAGKPADAQVTTGTAPPMSPQRLGTAMRARGRGEEGNQGPVGGQGAQGLPPPAPGARPTAADRAKQATDTGMAAKAKGGKDERQATLFDVPPNQTPPAHPSPARESTPEEIEERARRKARRKAIMRARGRDGPER